MGEKNDTAPAAAAISSASTSGPDNTMSDALLARVATSMRVLSEGVAVDRRAIYYAR